jgi:hypothetical protein
MSPELTELLRKTKEILDAMSPEDKQKMYQKQAEGWARSEAQWAKDFREGKCKYD